MTKELKPCPFCGGQARLYGRTTIYNKYIGCKECSARTGLYDDEEQATMAWNIRSQEEIQ